MFVLLNLIDSCLRCIFAPLFGMNQALAPARQVQHATKTVALPQPELFAPLHAPLPRLIV
jgi:hypothetical protein